ncbi:TetR family transcriptional regulator [Parafrankia colletiae]|uniref:TetR family transcriptional regulator n=1 Tax=Parafrankia colletiae TaxID=573497 RepID=A0A1S1QC44_9ACTN|nr:TetR/AcrR family transcriptional regulator [Parafrankia colletiae]MCK9903308.1 TetR/AcrR family transcriptional regulator [Frankia sp. Cpl3]OHV29824.1 TetR family transcriptional regulator [Parafrankia colletiae]
MGNPASRSPVPTTRQRLIEGALQTIRTHGIAGVSARTVAATAGVNQALVFYYFDTVDGLLSAACESATAERIAYYRDRFAAVGSAKELLRLGQELHETESQRGHVAVLAQLLAGAQVDSRLAQPVRTALQLWTAEVELVLRRLFADSPLADVTDLAGLARAVSAAFVGLELYDGVDPDGAHAATNALDSLAVLLDLLDSLGPLARRALRARTRTDRAGSGT